MFAQVLFFLLSQTQPPPPPLAAPKPQVTQPPGEGLSPLRPPEGAVMARSLRTSPVDTSFEVRQLKETDKIEYLRSQSEWYEVDVTTLEGLKFRGWLKGSLATERKLSEPAFSPTVTRPTSTGDPLSISGIKWFWGDMPERGKVRFHLGYQNLVFALSGTTSGGPGQPVPPGYNFNGLALFVGGEFIPMITKVFDKKIMPVLRLDYLFGLHRVSFSNPFPQIPEVAGKGYEVQTQCFRFDGIARLRAFEMSRGYIEIGLGLGFYYHTIAPDLSPVQGGSFDGQLVFFDNTLSALSIPLDIKIQLFDKFYLIPRFYYLPSPNISEAASQTSGLKVDGMPIAFVVTAGWNWTKSISLEAELDWLDAATKGGSGDRFGVAYTDGKTKVQSRRFMGGVSWAF